MKKTLLITVFCFLSAFLFAQDYEHGEICGPDTLTAPAKHPMLAKMKDIPAHRFIRCSRVSKIGLRIDAGFNTYAYNSQTKNWLGNHNGAVFGISVAYRNFSVGARFKPATVNPKEELDFDGHTLPRNADLNPIKVEYDISYSARLAHNFYIEPFAAVTSNTFFVINEDELNQHYTIPHSTGLTLGASLNKYIRLKDAEFIAVFARYGYGFTDFANTNSSLGKGYSDISIGVGYKGFFRRKIIRNV